MLWYQQIEQVILTAIGFIVAGLLTGAWWVVRTFFTDHGRIDQLEKSLELSRKEHSVHREDLKDTIKVWHEEVRHDFDNVNKTLSSIQEFLRK